MNQGDLNMYVEEIKPGFPDCIARRFTGRGWERVAVEFEFKSSHFRQHRHDPSGCDVIVCWENDWTTCPIEVIALRERIKEMENQEIARPGEMPASPQGDATEWARSNRVERAALSAGSESELRAALPWVTESLKRLEKAVRANEPTGWYATVGSGDDE